MTDAELKQIESMARAAATEVGVDMLERMDHKIEVVRQDIKDIRSDLLSALSSCQSMHAERRADDIRRSRWSVTTLIQSIMAVVALGTAIAALMR